ncbi:MAG: DsbE family thiol:disulfide interchange protein [Gammaproteobacteria bacterium]|nr:DsbE family thiol:disulfide interchange protein [Gammaproteobacteria bacterium]
MNRYLIPVCVFAALIALLALGLRFDPSRVPSPFIDQPVPSFTLPRLHEPDRTISPADLRGEVTLLNVWASWCVACRYEHALLLQLAREPGVRIYGLNYKDTHEDALRWLEAMGDPYVASGFDADGQVGIDLGVYGVPETFVVDRDGIIRHKHIGPLTEEQVRDTLLPLLDSLRGEQPAGTN